MWDFKTRVKLDYTPKDYEDRDVDVITKHVDIKWQLTLEMREWGVKSFYVMIPDQDIEVELEHVIYGDDDDIIETTYETVVIKLRDVDYNFDVPEMSENVFSQMAPYELVWDKYFKEIRFTS